MKRIKAYIFAWLGIGDFISRVTKALNAQTKRIDNLQAEVIALRVEIASLRNETAKRPSEQITLRIEPDYERGQQDALNEFRDKKGSD